MTKAELIVENWNLKHPVGTPVLLRKDSGEIMDTKTRSQAEVSASGHAVCWFDGVGGSYRRRDYHCSLLPAQTGAHLLRGTQWRMK